MDHVLCLAVDPHHLYEALATFYEAESHPSIRSPVGYLNRWIAPIEALAGD